MNNMFGKEASKVFEKCEESVCKSVGFKMNMKPISSKVQAIMLDENWQVKGKFPQSQFSMTWDGRYVQDIEIGDFSHVMEYDEKTEKSAGVLTKTEKMTTRNYIGDDLVMNFETDATTESTEYQYKSYEVVTKLISGPKYMDIVSDFSYKNEWQANAENPMTGSLLQNISMNIASYADNKRTMKNDYYNQSKLEGNENLDIKQRIDVDNFSITEDKFIMNVSFLQKQSGSDFEMEFGLKFGFRVSEIPSCVQFLWYTEYFIHRVFMSS